MRGCEVAMTIPPPPWSAKSASRPELLEDPDILSRASDIGSRREGSSKPRQARAASGCPSRSATTHISTGVAAPPRSAAARSSPPWLISCGRRCTTPVEMCASAAVTRPAFHTQGNSSVRCATSPQGTMSTTSCALSRRSTARTYDAERSFLGCPDGARSIIACSTLSAPWRQSWCSGESGSARCSSTQGGTRASREASISMARLGASGGFCPASWRSRSASLRRLQPTATSSRESASRPMSQLASAMDRRTSRSKATGFLRLSAWLPNLITSSASPASWRSWRAPGRNSQGMDRMESGPSVRSSPPVSAVWASSRIIALVFSTASL
mmetsp:Transcript_47088/g.150942  ORF Transcript_47088/g.150942 Transcript_47088/m.150942 type:complete len:327 (+) Transcript_47088:319-1299(+)